MKRTISISTQDVIKRSRTSDGDSAVLNDSTQEIDSHAATEVSYEAFARGSELAHKTGYPI